MKDIRLANMYRNWANSREEFAAEWKAFAVNKQHRKDFRIDAARKYRENMAFVARYRKLAEEFSK